MVKVATLTCLLQFSQQGAEGHWFYYYVEYHNEKGSPFYATSRHDKIIICKRTIVQYLQA